MVTAIFMLVLVVVVAKLVNYYDSKGDQTNG